MEDEELVKKMERIKLLKQEFEWVKIYLKNMVENDRVNFFLELKLPNSWKFFYRARSSKYGQAGLVMLELGTLREELKQEARRRAKRF